MKKEKFNRWVLESISTIGTTKKTYDKWFYEVMRFNRCIKKFRDGLVSVEDRKIFETLPEFGALLTLLIINEAKKTHRTIENVLKDTITNLNRI